MGALLEDRLFSNLAEQLPCCTARQIVHAMHRCYDHAPLAFVLLTHEHVAAAVRAQFESLPEALADANAFERNFDRAAQRVMRPRFSRRQCDAPCELPCAWVVSPHPEQDDRPCYPWQLAPEQLCGHDSVTSFFSRKRRHAGGVCAFEWACRCEACCHVWIEAANTTKFGANPPGLWGPRPPPPWSGFFVHGRPLRIREMADVDHVLVETL
jgi:hypothetical protein